METKTELKPDFELRADVKRDWLAALRSGEYKQAVGRLYDPHNGGYCCIGVLCKVLGAETADIAGKPMPYAVTTGIISELPLLCETPFTLGDYNLTEFNDEYGYSFDLIADEIDEHVATYAEGPVIRPLT